MENHDRSVFNIFFHIVKALIACECRIEISTEHGPHDYLVMFLKNTDLGRFDSPVRRTKKVCTCQGGGTFYIFEIFHVVACPPVEMVVGMTSNSVVVFF